MKKLAVLAVTVTGLMGIVGCSAEAPEPEPTETMIDIEYENEAMSPEAFNACMSGVLPEYREMVDAGEIGAEEGTEAAMEECGWSTMTSADQEIAMDLWK